MNDKKTKKTLTTFSFASFLNDLGADMISPIWPFFVTNFLGANMAVLGFLDGLSDAVVSISGAAAGYLSDRLKKRKIFIWLGYFCAGIARVGYAFTSIWPLLIPFKILDRSGKMREAPRDAIVAELSTEKNRGKNFGFLNGMDSLGAVCGIIVNILLFQYIGYKPLFLLAAIPSFLGVLLIRKVIKEKNNNSQVKLHQGIKLRDFNSNFRLFLLLSAIFTLGAFSYSFLLILAKEFGVKSSFLPVLYLLFTLFTSISDLIFGRLSDKIGRKAVLNISFLLWGLVCAIALTAHNIWLFVFMFILFGLHKGARETVQKAFVSELAIPKFKASSLGAYQMAIGFCSWPASFMAGMLWQNFGFQTTFYVSIGLTVIASGLLFFVKTPNNPINNK